jgi:hypothetical protein
LAKKSPDIKITNFDNTEDYNDGKMTKNDKLLKAKEINDRYREKLEDTRQEL